MFFKLIFTYNLEINKEDFLDRLASVKQPSKGGRPEFPYKEEVKQAVENLLKNKPNITQGKLEVSSKTTTCDQLVFRL